MIRRTLAVAFKEFLHLRRDWRTAATLLGMPLVLLLLFGFALSFDVRGARLAVIDLDGGRVARDLSQAFHHTETFTVSWFGRETEPLDRLFDRGSVQAALVIPHGTSAAVAAGVQAPIQLLVDGSDAQTATTLLAHARQIVAAVSSAHSARSAPPLLVSAVVWYNPELASPLFLVPGLVAFILMITAVIATALAVVREKERGTMESLRATPLVALELLVGKTLPYLVVAAAAAAGALALAVVLFDVPMRGSLLWLAAITVLFLLGGLGWGVLISSLADTQQVAFQMGLLSSMLPTLLLSGFVFPLSSMPAALQWISHVVPARYYLAAMRAIVLKGAGPEVWWPQTAGLAIYAGLVLTLATVRTVRSL